MKVCYDLSLHTPHKPSPSLVIARKSLRTDEAIHLTVKKQNNAESAEFTHIFFTESLIKIPAIP